MISRGGAAELVGECVVQLQLFDYPPRTGGFPAEAQHAYQLLDV